MPLSPGILSLKKGSSKYSFQCHPLSVYGMFTLLALTQHSLSLELKESLMASELFGKNPEQRQKMPQMDLLSVVQVVYGLECLDRSISHS